MPTKSVRLNILSNSKAARTDLDDITRVADRLGAKVITVKANLNDQAGNKIDYLEKKVTRLNGDQVVIKVRADDKDANANLDLLEHKVRLLDGKEIRIGVKTNASQLAVASTALAGLDKVLTIGDKNAGLFARGMAAVGVATGIAEPLVAGLIVTVMALGTQLIAAGAGLGALGYVASKNLQIASSAASSVSTAQNAYKASISGATTAYHQQMATATTSAQRTAAATAFTTAKTAALRAEVKATTVAYANLSPAQIKLSKQVGGIQSHAQRFTASFAPMTSQLLGAATPALPQIFSTIRSLAQAALPAVTALIKEMVRGLNSPGFEIFRAGLYANTGSAITGVAHAIGHVVVGIVGMFQAFGTASGGMLKGLDNITAKFAKWGQTLGQHSGFQSLMDMFHKESPIAYKDLLLLVQIVVRLAGSMAGLTTFSNNGSIFNFVHPFLTLLNYLLKVNPQMVDLGLYVLAFAGGVSKVVTAAQGLKTGVEGVRTLGTSVSKTATGVKTLSVGMKDSAFAASAASGPWGTVGGKIGGVSKGLKNAKSGFKDASVAASDASGAMGTFGGKISGALSAVGNFGKAIFRASTYTKIWTVVQAAFNFVMALNPVVLITVAIIALIAVIVLVTMHTKVMRVFFKAAWADIKNWAMDAWNWIKGHWPLLLGILTGPVGLAVVEIVTHFKTIKHWASDVWNWIKGNWPYLAGVLFGPFGIAVAIILKHLNTIKGFVRGVLNWIQNNWPDIVGYLLHPVNTAVAKVRNAFDTMRHNIASAFDAIRHDVSRIWDATWNETFGRLQRGVDNDERLLANFRHNISTGFDNLRHDIAHVWDQIWNNTVGRIQSGVRAAGNALNGLKNAFLSPIRWVVSHTIGPLDKVWNTLNHAFGSHLPTLPTSFGFAAGGHIGKVTRGTTPTADDVLIRASKDETVISAAHSRILAPALSAVGVPGYAGGGIVGNKGSANAGGGGGGGLFGGLFNFLSGLFSGLGKKVVTGLVNIIPGGQSVLKWLASNAAGKAAGAMRGIVDHTLPAKGAGGMVRAGADDLITAAAKAIASLFASNSAANGSGSSIVKYAESFLMKIPYVFGGTSVHGDDCSGFTQMVYKHFGYNSIPRTSEEQGRWVKRSRPIAGGLAFFNSPAGGPPPGHVGIVTGPGTMISQPGPQGALGPRRGSLAGAMFTGIPPGGFHQGGPGHVVGAFTHSAAVAQAYARSLLSQYGWSQGQMGSLVPLWNQESGWNAYAVNPSSGAYGIPQALGHGHPYALGDYKNQIIWGLNYIRSRYGSPAGAERHERAFNWYGKGGILTEPIIGRGLRTGRGYGFAENGPEMVTPMGRSSIGGPTNIYITVSGDTDPDGAARRIHQKLRTYKRHNGNKPLGFE